MINIKRLFIILSFIILCSCDKELFEDFFVKNNYSKDIELHVKFHEGGIFDTIIESKSILLLSTLTGFGNSVHKFELNSYFKSFEVTKDDTIKSKINYLLNENWEFKEFSDTHAEYRLVVDETHFE